MEGVQNDRHEAVETLSPVIQQQATTDKIYDDFMAELCNDNDILPLANNTFESLFQLDETFPLDYFSLEVLKDVKEGELGEVPTDIPAPKNMTKDTTSVIQSTPYSSEIVNFSISAREVVSNASTVIGEGPSKELAQELGGNKGVVNPILTSRNWSNSSLSLPQNNPNSWVVGPNAWNHPSGMNSTTVRSGTEYPQETPRVDASFGNPIFPNITVNSITQFQSPSFPVLPYGSSSSSSNIHQQFPWSLPLQMIGNNARDKSALVHRFSQRLFCPRPPSLRDFDNLVRAWKGCLIARVHSYRESLNAATAVRKPTSPVTLGSDWWCRLQVVHFLPTNTVDQTMKICGGPIDYVIFHITKFNNLDLYDHLKSKKLCAKIELPSQTIILSSTESKYHFLGSVFPKGYRL